MTAKKPAPAAKPATEAKATAPASKPPAKAAESAAKPGKAPAKPATAAPESKPAKPEAAPKATKPAGKAAEAKVAKPAKADTKADAKGKAAKKGAEPAKKGAAIVEEEDLSDIEADIEGEVEAEPEVAVGVVPDEKAEKVKPLRMKVSRAKERALMREFGLEETTLTEEEATKRRQELKTLIKMGKTRGFLTHQEINDHLPEKLINEEILEAIISMLNDMGIAVYEQAPDAATLLVAGGGATTATEEEAE
jgi:RNA polymerase primary sigma factor